MKILFTVCSEKIFKLIIFFRENIFNLLLLFFINTFSTETLTTRVMFVIYILLYFNNACSYPVSKITDTFCLRQIQLF